jgi:hypothetical protein
LRVRVPPSQFDFMSLTTFIYVLREPDTGEVRYVGKSDRPTERLSRHVRVSRPSNHRETWIISLKSRGLSPRLEVVDEVPRSEWPSWEAAYIDFFREQGFDLTNATPGGDCGPVHSGETHYRFGKHLSPEVRSKISGTLSGRPGHSRGKKRGHPWNFGLPMSLKAREHLSRRNSGEGHPNFGKKFPGRPPRSSESKLKTSATMKLVWAKRKGVL